MWLGSEQAMNDHAKLMAKRGLGTYCHFMLSEVQDKPWKDTILAEDKGKIEAAVQSTLDWLSGLDENNLVEEAEISAWENWLVGIVNPIMHYATECGTEWGPTLSPTDWLNHPPVATSPDERPPVQAAAASSRGDSCLSFAGISKWELCVQPEPPRMGETSVERAAFVAFTKEFLRSEFTDAELASMLELG